MEKNKCINFLSCLEGYHQQLKMVHWSTTNESEHTLTDKIDRAVLDFEDELAENLMGCLDIRFGIGDLKTLLPSHTELSGILEEMKKDVKDFRELCDDEGVIDVIKRFLSRINSWNFLKTLS